MTKRDPPALASWGEARPLGLLPPHEARESAIRILTDAYAYDAISELEFERRLATLSAADSAAAIGAVVADLPVIDRSDAWPSRRIVPEPSPRIIGFMSDSRRTGPWLVARELSIRAVMCNMTIDLRYAMIPPACTIEVTSVMSAVAILVSPGLTVDFDVQPYLASVSSDADGGRAVGRAEAHLRVHGSAVMSDVCVRVC